MSIEAGSRELQLLLPQVMGRLKRCGPAASLQEHGLGPRHLVVLAHLLFEGAMGVGELARSLELVPATTSLMVGELSRRGLVDRREDEADRRRTIVSITEARRSEVEQWLAVGRSAWEAALAPLTPRERALFVDTLRAFEQALEAEYPCTEEPSD